MNYSSVNKETYNNLAEEYELKAGKREKHNEQVLNNFIQHVHTGKNILDLGCGVGLDMALFVKKGFEVTGIDISEAMISYACARNPAANIFCGNFLEMNFKEKFDGIYALAFIHIFPKNTAIEVLHKIYALLKDNAVAQITTTKAEESKEGWFEKGDYNKKVKRYRKFWTKEELVLAIEETCFKIIEYYEIKDPYSKEWMVFIIKR